MRHIISTVLFVAAFAAVATYTGVAQQNQMSFFVSSAGPGNGANLGGLAGADVAFPALQARADGYQVYYVTDASGDYSAPGLIRRIEDKIELDMIEIEKLWHKLGLPV